MKNTMLILSVLIGCLSFTFLQNKDKGFRPPGTVEIVEGFFFDNTERTNLDWREYLTWIENKGAGKESKAYKSALPDTTVWLTEVSYGEPFKETYFSHPAYDNYPVVGISHKQAIAYCAWRTDRVKEMCKTNGIDVPNFKYRLPTNLEWELIATTGRNDHEKKIQKFIKKGNFDRLIYNMIYPEQPYETVHISPNKHTTKSDDYLVHKLTMQKEDGTKVRLDNPESRNISHSRSFVPNGYGIYNLIGNVSEMIAEKGVAKGGSFIDQYEEGIVSKKYAYDAPQKWLGFRCVAEILE